MSELDGRSSIIMYRRPVKRVCDEHARPDVLVDGRVQIGSCTGHDEPTTNPAHGAGFGSYTGRHELTANPARRPGCGSRSAHQLPAAAQPTGTDATPPEEINALTPLPEVVQPPGIDAVTPEELIALRPLPLDEAVRLAIRNNPRLQQQSAAVVASRASADAAFAPFLPEISTAFRYSGYSSPVLALGAFFGAAAPVNLTNVMFAEASIQQTLFDFGRRTGHYTQAMSRARIEEQTAIRARQTIAFEATQDYLHLLSAWRAVRVREEAMRDAEQILADTVARRQGGIAERESVLRAEVELSKSRQSLLVARQAVRDSTAMLNVVLGRPAQVPLRVVEIAVQPELNESLETCLGWAATYRREILMAREAVAEAQGGVQAARGELLPKVYVQGAVLRADSTAPLNTFIEGAGFHVEQPIYDGGRYRSDVRRSQAQVSAAYAGLRAITDNVSLQVNLAFDAIETERQLIDLGELSVTQARENLRLTRVRYDKGTATPTDIVEAQTAVVEAETTYYTAIYSYLEGLARLDYAIGSDQSGLLVQFRTQSAAPR